MYDISICFVLLLLGFKDGLQQSFKSVFGICYLSFCKHYQHWHLNFQWKPFFGFKVMQDFSLLKYINKRKKEKKKDLQETIAIIKLASNI